MTDWLAVAQTAVTEHRAAQKPGELAGLLELLAQVVPVDLSLSA